MVGWVASGEGLRRGTTAAGAVAGGGPTAVALLFRFYVVLLKSVKVVKTVNYVNYELSSEHWLGALGLRVTS